MPQTFHKMNVLQRRQFSFVAFVFQFIFILIFALFVRYDFNAMPHGKSSQIYVNTDYPMFQDIHVMVMVGFGFLMSFLKRYGFSSISINLLLSAFVMQYVMILRGFLSHDFVTTGLFKISINDLIHADLSCVVVLISMGVLLGRLTPIQFLFLAFLETSFATLLEHILFTILHVNDSGRALIVHCFGAYFGLTVAKVCERSTLSETDTQSGYLEHSELFSMIGTLFLWIFFPSFNGATQVTEDARYRAIMNTYLAMASCTLVTFMTSSLSDQMGRFNMLHIQSSTLSGGVAIGSVANVVLYPHHALLVGTLAGLVSVVGHVFITPKLLEKRFQLYDTCGVHNLHGLPSLISGFCGVYLVLHYQPEEYAENIHTIYPFWKGGSMEGANRDKYIQAGYQLMGMFITLAVAVFGGIITGFILNRKILNKVQLNIPSFADTNYYVNAKFSLLGNSEVRTPLPLYHSTQTARIRTTSENNNGNIPSMIPPEKAFF